MIRAENITVGRDMAGRDIVGRDIVGENVKYSEEDLVLERVSHYFAHKKRLDTTSLRHLSSEK